MFVEGRCDRVGKWISCKDRMPNDCENVLFATAPMYGKVPRILLGQRITSNGNGHWSTGISGFSDREVGWWMPLPAAPDYEDSID